MANKKYAFVAEKIYRTHYEVEIDLDEIRAKYDQYNGWEDEDILLDIAYDYGCFNSDNDWSVDECNVRTIYDVDNGDIVYCD